MNKMFQDAERYIAYTKLKEYYDIIYEEIKEKKEEQNEEYNFSICRFNE